MIHLTQTSWQFAAAGAENIFSFRTALAATAQSAFDYKILIWVVLGVIGFFVLVLLFGFLGPWFRAQFAGAPVGVWRLFCMGVRRVPVDLVVGANIAAVKSGLDIELDALEAHHLAGGNIINTVKALVAARRAGVALDWERASAIDLATRGTGKTVLDAVHAALNPKVVDFPDAVVGVAKDGIQLRAKVRVTVRTTLEHFIRGAQEETVVSRIGEALVAAIANAETYRDVLEKTVEITNELQSKRLDSGTALDLVSIDIVAIEIGENVGAKLREAASLSEKNVAQAQADIRRTNALASEQEMRAKVQRMRASVVEADAQVPLALAEALRAGRLGVVDFHRLENLKSDTQMRLKLGLPGEEWERGNK
jgi:uncharacterized protein YqfA (UPF0365 family)